MPKEKLKTIYVCTQCGETSPRWLGRCPSCGAWNTMTEDVVAEPAKASSGKAAAAPRVTGQTSLVPQKLKSISTTEEKSRIVTGISELDIAKRLIDCGFHAPTMSFPVAGTLMVEPTESESKVELDRFIDAMLAIRAEIDQVKAGVWPLEDNPLVNAPHIQSELVAEWAHPYSREVAVFPAGVADKYWPTVKRLDDVYGDRNLFCSCVPISEYQ